MNLVDSFWRAGFGAAAGAFVACLLGILGVSTVLGLQVETMLYSGLFAGAVVGVVRQERWILGAAAVLVVTYAFVTNTPTMEAVARRWVRVDNIRAPQDAIVVLSGYVLTDSALNVEGTEHLLSGIELYRAGVAPRLVTTRVAIADADGPRSSTFDQQRLMALTGSVVKWTRVSGGGSTHDEAVSTAALLLPAGARRIVVVTSPFHTRRACATFEAVGFTVSCRPSLERQVTTWHPINSEGRLAAFGAYVYERCGMIKYRWKGWLPANT